MNFIEGKVKEFYLLTSEVENIFLNEYMPFAPGDYVKVYLFGLMYAKHREEMSHGSLARHLRISEEELEKAWTYWADMGVVKKHRHGNPGILNYDIEFINLRDQMYGHTPNVSADHESQEEPVGTQSTKEEEKSMPLVNPALKDLLVDVERISGKVLSPMETQEIFSWTQDFGAAPEVILRAFEYCYQREKDNIKYIAKVVAQWSQQGFQTREEVEAFLETVDQRNGTYKRILQALGLNRSATEAEREMMDQWLDEMGYNMERILEACGKTVSISNPNLRYVNKVLENWQQEAKRDGRDVNKKVTVTQTVLNKYYEYLRKKAETEAKERKEEVYHLIPRIAEIDQLLNDLGSSISRNLLSGNRAGVEEIRTQMSMLEGERAVLLTESNFNMDYTDMKYLCDECKDSGYTEDGQRCSCINKRMEEAELWQKTN